jgi:hypothetical protein
LVYDQICHAKTGASQYFGKGFVRPRFATAWAQKTAVTTEILAWL